MTDNNIIFGLRAVIEAIEAGRDIDKIIVKKDMQGELSKELFYAVKGKNINIQKVPVERINRITRKNHQGVIAYISKIDYVPYEEMIDTALATEKNPVIVILDGVSDVRNLGAIARTLECAGGCGIIVPAKGGAAINADAIKASAGALMRISVSKVPNLRLAAYYLKQSGFKIIAVTEKVSKLIYDADMTGPCAFVMGSEGKGISSAMLELADDRAAIPMAGEISSLNVSAATSIVLYEAVRQHLQHK